MTTKRTPLDRRRKPVIDREVVKLFSELENVPKSRRDGKAFREGEEQLHRRLGLYGELFLSGRGANVLSRSRENPWSLGYYHRESWQRCREVRQMLLAASGLDDRGRSRRAS